MEVYTRFMLSTTATTMFRIDRFSVTVSPNIGDTGLSGYHILVVNNTTGLVAYETDQEFMNQIDRFHNNMVVVTLSNNIQFLTNDYDGLYTFNISFGRYKERKMIGNHKVNVMKDYYMAIVFESNEYKLKSKAVAVAQ